METIAKNKWKKLMTLARAGDHEAQWLAGYYHEYGAKDKARGVLTDINISEAMRWYTLSAKQGNTSAQISLSNILSTMEGIIDYQAAIYWAKKAIVQGDASAAFNLGTIYRDLNKPATAFRWYTRAASMGDNDALLQIGLSYLFGFGVKQDLDEANICFKGVIDSDSVSQRSKENAFYWMAVLQLICSGKAKKSFANAKKMLEIANADDDHEQANEILNLIGKTRKS